MIFYIVFLVINLLLFISLLIAIYHHDNKNEKMWLLIYLVLNMFLIVALFYSLRDIKCYTKIKCREYSVETIVTQFENKSDTTYILHLKR